jgi:hypothetical protein
LNIDALLTDLDVHCNRVPGSLDWELATHAIRSALRTSAERGAKVALSGPTPLHMHADYVDAPLTNAFKHRLYREDICLTTEPTFQEMLDFARSLERRGQRMRERIERALLPDPHDERDVSVDWLRKEIRKAFAEWDALKGG